MWLNMYSAIQRMFQSLRQLSRDLQVISLAQILRHAQVSDPHTSSIDETTHG